MPARLSAFEGILLLPSPVYAKRQIMKKHGHLRHTITQTPGK